MKRILLLGLFSIWAMSLIAQTQKTTPTNTSTSRKSGYDEFWISGSIGAGGVLSTNIINSGAVLPFRTELAWQKRHRRLGLGFGHELYLTPEALGNLILGNSVGIHKLYFVYEQYLFRNFPINLGFSSHLGFFGTGDSTHTKTTTTTTNGTTTTTSVAKGGVFGNAGVVVELGIRPFYIFARPDIEYQSWSGFHKQIQVTVSAGVKLKFLSAAEKERRAEKRARRRRK